MGYEKFKRPMKAPSFTPNPTGIALADLAQGTNGQLPIAQTSAATAYKTTSGDVTIDKDGVMTIGAGKVADTMLKAPAASGLGTLRCAHAKYDFAVDGGGAPGEIVPAANATIPDNAILIGATINSPTALGATGGAASITIGTHAGSAANSILTITAKGSFTTDAVLNGTVTLAAPVKMTAAGQISITSSTNALTSGVLEIFVYYVVAGE